MWAGGASRADGVCGIFWSCGVEFGCPGERGGAGGRQRSGDYVRELMGEWGGGGSDGRLEVGGYVGEISLRHIDVADFANTEGKSYAKAVNLA